MFPNTKFHQFVGLVQKYCFCKQRNKLCTAYENRNVSRKQIIFINVWNSKPSHLSIGLILHNMVHSYTKNSTNLHVKEHNHFEISKTKVWHTNFTEYYCNIQFLPWIRLSLKGLNLFISTGKISRRIILCSVMIHLLGLFYWKMRLPYHTYQENSKNLGSRLENKDSMYPTITECLVFNGICFTVFHDFYDIELLLKRPTPQTVSFGHDGTHLLGFTKSFTLKTTYN